MSGFQFVESYLDTKEIEYLVNLWNKTKDKGWPVYRASNFQYTFTPCDTKEALVKKALNTLPISTHIPYVDSFFLYYKEGTFNPSHRDSRSSLRLNACLISPSSGGELCIAETAISMKIGDAVIFKPAEEKHSVSTVYGERLVWSVGRTTNIKGY